jgi:hypothetical protein
MWRQLRPTHTLTTPRSVSSFPQPIRGGGRDAQGGAGTGRAAPLRDNSPSFPWEGRREKEARVGRRSLSLTQTERRRTPRGRRSREPTRDGTIDRSLWRGSGSGRGSGRVVNATSGDICARTWRAASTQRSKQRPRFSRPGARDEWKAERPSANAGRRK